MVLTWCLCLSVTTDCQERKHLAHTLPCRDAAMRLSTPICFFRPAAASLQLFQADPTFPLNQCLTLFTMARRPSTAWARQSNHDSKAAAAVRFWMRRATLRMMVFSTLQLST